MRDSSPALETEQSLLLAACSALPADGKLERIAALLQKSIRWDSFLELADRHGVSPLVYQAFSQAGGVPAELKRALQQRYQTNLHKTLFLARELIRVLDCLDLLGVDVLPYKGLALAETMYGDIALRLSGDIDLLVRAKDFLRIKAAVGELGYAPHSPLSAAEERAYLASGYECSFDGAAGANLLELQWALQPRFYAVDIDMDGLFRRAVPVAVAARPMKTLSPEDQILVLSVHAAKHVWGRLIWLCDIAQIMKLPALNWDWIAGQARSLGILRILGTTLRLANRLLGAEIPASLRDEISQDREVEDLTNIIASQMFGANSFDVESLAYFRLTMRLRERKMDRIRFLQRLMFTPGPGEWKVVRLPEPLFPLYRLVRLSRLAARFGRTENSKP